MFDQYLKFWIAINDNDFQIQPTSGTWPRHFKISMSGKLMFVSLQLKNKLEVYKIEQSSGALERLTTLESSNSPAYVGIF